MASYGLAWLAEALMASWLQGTWIGLHLGAQVIVYIYMWENLIRFWELLRAFVTLCTSLSLIFIFSVFEFVFRSCSTLLICIQSIGVILPCLMPGRSFSIFSVVYLSAVMVHNSMWCFLILIVMSNVSNGWFTKA